jgi:hypothetical protein
MTQGNGGFETAPLNSNADPLTGMFFTIFKSAGVVPSLSRWRYG